MSKLIAFFSQFKHRAGKDFLLIFIGANLQAFSLRLFLIPALLASGGVSGISQIINHFYGWPIGLMILVGNIPLFFLGWRHLGGLPFATRTAFTVLIFALATDLYIPYLPPEGITNDLLLNALYGGVISGVGYGLVYRGQGTSGGTDILAKIISKSFAIPLSQTYMLTDALIMFLAGLAFSWENAMYAIVMLYVSGLVAETVSQGSRVVRTAVIITTHPESVGQSILEIMQRGITRLDGTGMYTGQARAVLYCVITRMEVERLKAIIAEVDPQAFIVIGTAHEVLGEGFQVIEAKNN